MSNDVNWNDTEQAYDAIVGEAKALMLVKNHDYGESWREMRTTSITDQILTKVRRIRQLEDFASQGKQSKVAEGIESEYRDILNYAVFGLIKMKEQ